MADPLAIRAAALARIRALEDTLQSEYGLRVQLGGELEFHTLDGAGNTATLPPEAQQSLEAAVRDAHDIHKMHAEGFQQMEVVAKANAPSLAAGELIALRDTLARQAQAQGNDVSFSAKHDSVHGGSGIHLNYSLWSPEGRNLFMGDNGPSELGQHVITSMLAAQHDIAPAYIEGEDGYARLHKPEQSAATGYAQIYARTIDQRLPNNAFNHRGMEDHAPSSIRVSYNKDMRVTDQLGTFSNIMISGKGDYATLSYRGPVRMTVGGNEKKPLGNETEATVRIENRLPGANVDPYVAVAADLGAMVEGLKRGLTAYDGTTPIDDKTQTLVTFGDKRFLLARHDGEQPRLAIAANAQEAAERLRGSDHAKQVLGDTLFHALGDGKLQEALAVTAANPRVQAFSAALNFALNASTNGIGVAGGAGNIFNSRFNHDFNNAQTASQKMLAAGGLLADGYNMSFSALGAVRDAEIMYRNGKASFNLAAYGDTARFAKLGAISNKVAVPLLIASGATDAAIGYAQGDGERVAGAAGRTIGAYYGGMWAGAALGATYGAISGSPTGVGAVVTGFVGAVGGAVAGGIYGEDATRAMFRNLKPYKAEQTPEQKEFFATIDALPDTQASFMSTDMKQLVTAKQEWKKADQEYTVSVETFASESIAAKHEVLSKKEDALSDLYVKVKEKGSLADIKQESAVYATAKAAAAQSEVTQAQASASLAHLPKAPSSIAKS